MKQTEGEAEDEYPLQTSTNESYGVMKETGEGVEDEYSFQTSTNESYGVMKQTGGGAEDEYDLPQNPPPSTSQPTATADGDSIYELGEGAEDGYPFQTSTNESYGVTKQSGERAENEYQNPPPSTLKPTATGDGDSIYELGGGAEDEYSFQTSTNESYGVMKQTGEGAEDKYPLHTSTNESYGVMKQTGEGAEDKYPLHTSTNESYGVMKQTGEGVEDEYSFQTSTNESYGVMKQTGEGDEDKYSFQTSTNESYGEMKQTGGGDESEYDLPQNAPPSTSQPTATADGDSIYEPGEGVENQYPFHTSTNESYGVMKQTGGGDEGVYDLPQNPPPSTSQPTATADGDSIYEAI